MNLHKKKIPVTPPIPCSNVVYMNPLPPLSPLPQYLPESDYVLTLYTSQPMISGLISTPLPNSCPLHPDLHQLSLFIYIISLPPLVYLCHQYHMWPIIPSCPPVPQDPPYSDQNRSQISGIPEAQRLSHTFVLLNPSGYHISYQPWRLLMLYVCMGTQIYQLQRRPNERESTWKAVTPSLEWNGLTIWCSPDKGTTGN